MTGRSFSVAFSIDAGVHFPVFRPFVYPLSDNRPGDLLRVLSGQSAPQSVSGMIHRGRPNRSDSLELRIATGLLALVVVCCGCRTITIDAARRVASVASLGNSNAIGTKPIRRVHRLGPVAKLFASSPTPSDRTNQLLRRYVLDDQYRMDPEAAIRRLQENAASEPGLERTHAVAELAFLQGEWASRLGQSQRASRMYATAMESAYRFLFDPELDVARNAYDPQFRNISDIYNQSLESILRRLIKSGELAPGNSVTLETIDSSFTFSIDVPGRWKSEKFEKFELVNDFQVQGLHNQYRTYGLGVPLIAVRQSSDPTPKSFEEHYPPGLTMALTAFLQLDELPSRDPYAPAGETGQSGARLSLLDPLEQTFAEVGRRMVPLESDVTTPMAWYLNDPLLNTNVFATLALLNADFANDYEGLYMLEPYDPNKIPVVMIHGLWSSPVTWLQMFNDLRADRSIRENYQFWFCLYPTGQPWWESARQVRAQLGAVREKLNISPGDDNPDLPFNQRVLVGHSMGGLVATMQAVESCDNFWSVISEHDPQEFDGDPETIRRLEDTYFFSPNPAVRRVVTLATPHQGSSYANETTRWLSRKAFSLPQVFTGDYAAFTAKNRALIANSKPLTVATSVDSLAPDSPFFERLGQAQRGDAIAFHNIYGKMHQNAVKLKLGLAEEGDGVVGIDSARLAGAESEIEIDSAHNTIHQTPQAILEVKRILQVHLAGMERMHPQQVISQVGGKMLEPIRSEIQIPARFELRR